MIMENRVNDLLEAPDALLIIERAQAILADESNRRHAFREWLTDDVKAEFINGEVIIHSPVKRRHLNASKYLLNLLLNYVMRHDLGVVDSEKALVGLTGFIIPMRAMFDKKANLETLQEFMAK